MMDPFLSLLAAALATSTLRVGTGVALPLEHDVFSLAKAVTTLDRLSGGRFDFGVGVGWNEEELADHRPDVPWAARYQALAECVAALRALWVDEEPAHRGRWFGFDAVWSEPKPLQSPHPPVVGGMAGRLGTEHVVRWADAWMPMDLALGDVAKRIRRFREALDEAGRPPIPIILGAWGDPTLEQLLDYAALGVEQVVLGAGRAGWDDPATALPFVDRYAELVPELGA
jgi:probable F420-dependent oxidoreductase